MHRYGPTAAIPGQVTRAPNQNVLPGHLEDKTDALIVTGLAGLQDIVSLAQWKGLRKLQTRFFREFGIARATKFLRVIVSEIC